MPQKTEYEILKETVEYYAADPLNRRSTKQGDCVYTPPGNQTEGCAVSRCVKSEKKLYLSEEWYDTSIDQIGSDRLEAYLQPEYQGHDIELWMDLQQLHDLSQHWTKHGLSQEGYECALQLAEKYGEGQDHSWLEQYVNRS